MKPVATEFDPEITRTCIGWKNRVRKMVNALEEVAALFNAEAHRTPTPFQAQIFDAIKIGREMGQ